MQAYTKYVRKWKRNCSNNRRGSGCFVNEPKYAAFVEEDTRTLQLLAVRTCVIIVGLLSIYKASYMHKSFALEPSIIEHTKM